MYICDDSSSCDDPDTGWKVYGGVMLHPKVGLEIGEGTLMIVNNAPSGG